MADVETHMRKEHGDISLAISEMKGFCRPTVKVENIKKEKESNLINWANIKVEPTPFVDFSKQREEKKGKKIQIKGIRVKKVQRKKKSEVKSMLRCDVKLNSCRDLIRKLTKGNTGNCGNTGKGSNTGNDGNPVQEKDIGLNRSELATIQDQLLQMQEISEDEDDLPSGSALLSGDISD